MQVITGGTGSMGRRLARTLLAQGKKVRVLHLPDDPAINGGAGVSDQLQELLRAGVEFVPADVTRFESLANAFHGAERIFHLAAILLAPRNPHLFAKVNLEGTRNALKAARNAGVTQFIHVSSISVHYKRENAYSESKRKAETAVRECGIPFTILRPSLAYCEDGGVEFMRFVEYLQRGRMAFLPCRGAARKSPVHVEDLIQAFISAAGNPLAIDRIYDLTGGESMSLKEMAGMILEHMRIPKVVMGVPSSICRLGVWASALSSFVTGKANAFTYQTFTGFLESADFPCDDARRDLNYNPRTFRKGLSGLPRWGGETRG